MVPDLRSCTMLMSTPPLFYIVQSVNVVVHVSISCEQALLFGRAKRAARERARRACSQANVSKACGSSVN